MEIKRKKRGGFVTMLMILISGVLIVGGSLFIFSYIMKGVYGPYAFSKDLFALKSIGDIVGNSDLKFAIVYSKKTENMQPEGSTWMNDNVATWKKFLDGYKFKYDVVSDEDLEQGKLKEYDAIILPGVKSMSNDEVTQVKRYLEAGGAVFATGGTACYAEGGKWRGWEFFREVFGFNFVRDLMRTRETLLHTLRGNMPITANIPIGYTMKVATWDNPIAVRVLEPRATQVSFWYNFRSDSGLVAEEVKMSAGMVQGNYGAGKYVWMGFDLLSVVGVQEDYVVFDRLIKNALYWLTNRPVSFIKPWPAGYDAAAVVVASIDEEQDNIKNLLPILRKHKVSASFILNAELLENNSTLFKSLSAFGDIGVTLDIGYMESVNDTINKLNDLNTQTDQMKKMRETLRGKLGNNVIGLNPYYGLFDDNTLMAMASAGYKYVITDSLTDRSEPKQVIKGDKPMIIVTKTARDDYEIIRRDSLMRTDFQIYTYEEDIDRLIFEGGLYVLKVHTGYQLQPQFAGVVDTVLQYMKSKRVWITSLPELQGWWEMKKKVEMQVEPVGKRRIAIRLSNVGDKKVSKFTLPVEFPKGVKKYSMSTEIIGTKMPKTSYDKKEGVLTLDVSGMEPGETRIYYVDFALDIDEDV